VAKPTDKLSSIDYLKSQRRGAKRIINHYQNSTSKPIQEAVRKLKYCSVFSAFKEVNQSTGELHKVGQALCKNRLCPTCQRVLSKKRKSTILEYFKNEWETYKSDYFYHVVFTMKHNSKVRNWNYASELVKAFKSLRSNRSSRQWFKESVRGGWYSVEVKMVNDLPHIHMHCIFISPNQLEGKFTRELKKEWLKVTKDSSVVRVDKIYTKERSNTCEKPIIKPYEPNTGSYLLLSPALAESAKYSVKMDFGSENDGYIREDILTDLLSNRTRLHGRFGCLYGVKELNAELTKEDDVNEKELDYSYETGEVVDESKVRFVIAKTDDVVSVKHESGNYSYRLTERSRPTYIEAHRAKELLAKSLSKMFYNELKKDRELSKDINPKRK
jgi:hypothetical protein